MVLIILVLFSCSKNTKEENNAIALDDEPALSDVPSSQTMDQTTDKTTDFDNADSTAQLNNSDSANAAEDINTATIDNDAIVFPTEYGSVQRWNSVAFAQADAQVQELAINEEISLVSLITRNVLVKNPRFSVVTPYDTIIGKLQNITTGDDYDMAIYDLWKQVIEQIKSGLLDKNIQQYVIESEIAVISRQIANASKYSSSITSFRMGEIATESPNSRYMRTRIFASLPDFDSQAELIVYVLSIEGRWYISAIEGNFDDLLVAYQRQGQFEPAGTLGVTQGL